MDEGGFSTNKNPCRSMVDSFLATSHWTLYCDFGSENNKVEESSHHRVVMLSLSRYHISLPRHRQGLANQHSMACVSRRLGQHIHCG